ncbi:MAG TPA: hydrogenase maturation protease [Anaerolineales bacterium]|nr:hydrogenase maturation protease [Anaerolineales bacterium]
MNEIIVIGIGQELRGDDGAGLAVVCRWQRQYPQTSSRVRVELYPLPGLDLINVWDGARVAIIVDAVHCDARPGSLYKLNPDDLASFGADAASAHGWGLAETLKLAAELALPGEVPEIRTLAISGSNFKLGTGLSPAVKRALPAAVAHLQEMVNGVLDQDAVLESSPINF